MNCSPIIKAWPREKSSVARWLLCLIFLCSLHSGLENGCEARKPENAIEELKALLSGVSGTYESFKNTLEERESVSKLCPEPTPEKLIFLCSGKTFSGRKFSGLLSETGLPDSRGILSSPRFPGECLGHRAGELGEIEGVFRNGKLQRTGTPLRFEIRPKSGFWDGKGSEVYLRESVQVSVDRSSEYFEKRTVLLGRGTDHEERSYVVVGRVFR